MPAFLLWPAIRLFLGGVVQKVVQWLSHRSFWQLAFMAALLFGGIQTFRVKAEQRHTHKIERQLSKVIAGREADRAAYAKAQLNAAAQNKAHVQKIEQQYQRNSDDERQSYLDDLARLRGMRGQGFTAQGAPGRAGSPAPHSTAAGADANGLPVPASDDVQAAAEIELRLMHLQNWVEKQLSVDPN